MKGSRDHKISIFGKVKALMTLISCVTVGAMVAFTSYNIDLAHSRRGQRLLSIPAVPIYLPRGIWLS